MSRRTDQVVSQINQRFRVLIGKLPHNNYSAIVAIVAVGVIGTMLLNSSLAATPTASLEVESGTRTGNVTQVSDVTASGGNAIKFGTAVVEPPPPSTSSCALPKYPDASCTGVPVGTTLTTVDGDLTISTDGAVVEGKDVLGCIIVRGAGVTVKNSKAECIITEGSHAENPANPRLTVQDTEIDCGPGTGGTAILWRNINVYRVNIHGCENGLHIDADFTVQDSYIHDLDQCVNAGCTEPDAHTDGIQSPNGSNTILDHNTIYGFSTGCVFPNDGTCNGTSAININNSSGGPTSSNVTISNNLLAGGAVTLYCPIPATANFRIINNHFSTIYSPKVGEFGPSTDCSGEIVSGNVYHETGMPITLN